VQRQQSKLSRAVRTLNTAFRLLVMGTPLQNNLHTQKLWALQQ